MRFFAAVLLSASALLGQGQDQDFSVDLLQAALRGRNGQVKAFLDDGADLEAVDRNGRTALMLAASTARFRPSSCCWAAAPTPRHATTREPPLTSWRCSLRWATATRSEERRVGKECRSRWSADH